MYQYKNPIIYGIKTKQVFCDNKYTSILSITIDSKLLCMEFHNCVRSKILEQCSRILLGVGNKKLG